MSESAVPTVPTPPSGLAQTVPGDPGVPGERLAFLGLVFWVALMGADRIDLLGGRMGFALTPFLALTPLLLLMEGLRLGVLRARVKPPDRRAAGYALALACLLCVALTSSLDALDLASSAKRSVNLVALSVGTLLVALSFGRRPWLKRALAAGAEVGIVLTVVFTAAQVGSFLAGARWTLHLGPATVNLEPIVYAGVLPRLTGQVGDANRAGLLLLFYVFLIARGRDAGVRRRVGVGLGCLLILLTLSRSAVLAGLAAGAVAFLTSPRARVSRPVLLGSTAVAGAAVLILLGSPGARRHVGAVLHPVASRLSFTEGSAEEHAYLFTRGVGEATTSVRRTALGTGYGDSFLLLQDVFPGNKYGNFHSLYITLLVESGVLALTFALLLMGYPLLRPGPYLPMVVALWVFDFSYQAVADPAFWLILALAWLTSTPFASRRRGLPQAEPAGP